MLGSFFFAFHIPHHSSLLIPHSHFEPFRPPLRCLLSTGSTTGSSGWNRPSSERWQAAGNLRHPIFSVFLSDSDEEDSEITFGDVKEERMVGSMCLERSKPDRLGGVRGVRRGSGWGGVRSGGGGGVRGLRGGSKEQS